MMMMMGGGLGHSAFVLFFSQQQQHHHPQQHQQQQQRNSACAPPHSASRVALPQRWCVGALVRSLRHTLLGGVVAVVVVVVVVLQNELEALRAELQAQKQAIDTEAAQLTVLGQSVQEASASVQQKFEEVCE